VKILIANSNEDNWYKDAIGRDFDVIMTRHPTFGYLHYILEYTEDNRKYFEGNELSLLILRSGHFGVNYEDALTY
jgi:hypothetical protein